MGNLHALALGGKTVAVTGEAPRFAERKDTRVAGAADLITNKRIVKSTVIVEDGQQWVCGRCVEIPGLCEQCGYLFSAELSLLFSGRPRVVADAVHTYGRYL